MNKKEHLALTARSIADSLFATEEAIDQGIIRANELLAKIGAAKSITPTTVFHAQETLEALSGLLETLVQARRKAGTLHSSMAGMQSDFGLAGFTCGPVGKPTGRLSSINEATAA